MQVFDIFNILQEEMERCLWNKEAPYLIFLEEDEYKNVNETLSNRAYFTEIKYDPPKLDFEQADNWEYTILTRGYYKFALVKSEKNSLIWDAIKAKLNVAT